MVIRSKAPLRISFAGGGTDVSPYSDIYGGAILNATINQYAYATIEPLDSDKIVFNLVDLNEELTFPLQEALPTNHKAILAAGIYNRIVKDFSHKPLSFRLTTSVDAPPGSGLGTSSSIAVAILGAFTEWLKLPLGEYDLARIAYQIEREDLQMAGGKQDQYAATFGGFNYMEFYADDKVIVNPLRIKERYLFELANNIVLFNTETSRLSSKIIEAQQKNVREGNSESINAMHNIKLQAQKMKEAILTGELEEIGEILNFGWEYKKQMAKDISNTFIEQTYQTALQAGATGGKISGAGGGGFMFFYCPVNTRYQVINELTKIGGTILKFSFTNEGLQTWAI